MLDSIRKYENNIWVTCTEFLSARATRFADVSPTHRTQREDRVAARRVRILVGGAGRTTRNHGLDGGDQLHRE